MRLLGTLMRESAHAARRLRRSPLFVAAAVACFATGIATNTAMFSVFDAIVLGTLPFEHPEQLVSLHERDQLSGRRASLSYPDYLDWRDGATAFQAMAAYSGRTVAITEGQAERVAARLISASLLPMLGVEPQLGRGFGADDDSPGASPTVLLADSLWRRRFGADADVVGRDVSLNHEPYTVIGVMPPGFDFPGNAALWMPMAPALAGTARDQRGVSVMARLRPDTDLARARAEVATISRRLHRRHPAPVESGPHDWTGEVRPTQGSFMGSEEKIVATAMLGASLFLLLIACSNVANLLLTRAVAHQRETAVRLAIGASRTRIVIGYLAEGLLLASAACLVSLPVTWEALRLIAAAIPPSDAFPSYVDWSLDPTTFLYAAGVSLATGAIFGVAPALLVSSGRLQQALKSGTPGAGSAPQRRHLRDALVVGQVALALILLVGASLFVRTFVGLDRMDLGYDPARIMTMRFYLPGERYADPASRESLVHEVVRQVSALPGVAAATVSDLVPLDDEGGSWDEAVLDVEPTTDVDREIAYAGVAGDWFGTFDVATLAGRTFTEGDLVDGTPVAVVNRTMATRFWPGSGALGHRFRRAGDASETWFTVIGVVSDIRTVKLDEDMRTPPTAYLPSAFVPTRDYAVIVRTPREPTSVTAPVRKAIAAADSTVPVFNVWSMERVRTLSFWMYAMWGAMFASFGLVALLLATVGVYAAVFYSVTQRTREIGVRVTLGARTRQIVGLVLRQGLTLAGIGIGFGLVGAFVLTRVVASLLIGVSATDPAIFAGVAIALVVVVSVAASLPARWAARVDPLVALRSE